MKENDDKPGSKLQELITLINMASTEEKKIIFEQLDLEMRQRARLEVIERVRAKAIRVRRLN